MTLTQLRIQWQQDLYELLFVFQPQRSQSAKAKLHSYPLQPAGFLLENVQNCLAEGRIAASGLPAPLRWDAIATLPTATAMYVTRSEADRLIADAIKHAVQVSKQETNRTVSGFAARMFHELPKLISKAIEESNPGLKLDAALLTASLQESLTEYAIANDRTSVSVR